MRQLVDGGLTAVAAIHDLNLAARFCDRLVLLAEGRVLTEGTPQEVLTPETFEAAFSVHAAVHRDPATGALAISLIAPAESAAVESAVSREIVESPPGELTAAATSEATGTTR